MKNRDLNSFPETGNDWERLHDFKTFPFPPSMRGTVLKCPIRDRGKSTAAPRALAPTQTNRQPLKKGTTRSGSGIPRAHLSTAMLAKLLILRCLYCKALSSSTRGAELKVCLEA
jgi:hypothetical protein